MDISEKLIKMPEEYEKIGPYSVSVKKAGFAVDYHFSCPIITLEGGEMISDEWKIKGKKRVHTGINCKTEMSGEKVTIHNYIGKVTLGCAGCEVFPSRNGVRIISQKQTAVLRMRTDGSFGLLENNSSTALMMSKHYPFLTVSGLTAYSETEKHRVPVLLKTVERGGGYDLTAYTEADDALPELEINLYFPKLMLDTCPEVRYPYKRNPYGAVAYIGENPYTGDGWLFSRLNMAQPGMLRQREIDSAKIYMYTFELAGEAPVYGRAAEAWCSFNMDWNGKTEYMQKMNGSDVFRSTESAGNYLAYDITDTVKTVFGDGKFSPGVIIKGKNSSFAAAATADCYSFPQILEIKYRI